MHDTYLDPNRNDYLPLIYTKDDEILQLFAVIKDGKTVCLFAIDHREWPSATAYLAHLRKHNIPFPFEGDFDYIRTATKQELDEYLKDKGVEQ